MEENIQVIHTSLDALHLIIPQDESTENSRATLTGYQTLHQIKSKAAEYRLGYKNWRQKHARGARGDNPFVVGDNPVSNLLPSELLPPLLSETTSIAPTPDIPSLVIQGDIPILNDIRSLQGTPTGGGDHHRTSVVFRGRLHSVTVISDLSSAVNKDLFITEPTSSRHLSSTDTDAVTSAPPPAAWCHPVQLFDPHRSFPAPLQLPVPPGHVEDIDVPEAATEHGKFIDEGKKLWGETGRVCGQDGAKDEGQEVQHDQKVEEESKVTHEWLRFYYNPLTPAVEWTSALALSEQTLSSLPNQVIVPSYRIVSNRDVEEWIVHIGVGGFHRSHQAVYLDDVLHKYSSSTNAAVTDDKCNKDKEDLDVADGGLEMGVADRRWGLCGVGLTAFDEKMKIALEKQDMLYTVLTRSSTTSEARVIGSMYKYLYVPQEPYNTRKMLADKHTRIVSLTVTEKGYCQGTDSHLDLTNEFVKSDLQDLTIPRTAIGLITEGLRLRRESGVQPFTVLSCDNLPDNGNVLRRMVVEFSALIDSDLSRWISDSVW
eukprot:GHVQ01041928.1.p1 GENE.GHVQ01041928.1~~GHVQ01041928.1.p1  ORF type:complete len:542 (-),score=91.64 GHVQ01041928.1:3329-4954(-)